MLLADLNEYTAVKSALQRPCEKKLRARISLAMDELSMNFFKAPFSSE